MNDLAFARALGRLGEGTDPFAVATIVRTVGSSLGKPGFKILIAHDGEVLAGSLGGGCPEGPVVAAAQKAMKKGRPTVLRVYLEDTDAAVQATVEAADDEVHVETDCGGVLEVYVEPYLPRDRLVILGQGGRDDVEDHLVQLGKALDFNVVVVDHAPSLSSPPDELLDALDFDLRAYPWQPSDAVVLLVKSEASVGMLADLSACDVRYVGLLASRSRARKNVQELRDRGVSQSFLDRVRTPVGLDIGARTPGEIALSILAEIVAVRRGGRPPEPEETGRGGAALQDD